MNLRVALVAVLVAAFVGGFLLGRAFPAHRYVPLGTGPYILDTGSGAVCTPYQVGSAVPVPVCRAQR